MTFACLVADFFLTRYMANLLYTERLIDNRGKLNQFAGVLPSP